MAGNMDISALSERYDLRMTAAYIRGALWDSLDEGLRGASLDGLTSADLAALLALAGEAGLTLHYFKRQESLPRVKKALGFLRGAGGESLLAVGSGRGGFLLPFLREFPGVPVTSLDVLEKRVAMLAAMRRGGLSDLTPLRADICVWDAPPGSFDAVTLLEVLEHIPDVAAAVRNAVRLARRWVVVTVPSKPDDNPEHIHLLTKPVLEDLFAAAGCRALRFDGVPGHLFMAARTGR